MRTPFVALALAACSTSPSTDIDGPITGPESRYTIDSLVLATDEMQAAAIGDDLEGNGQFVDRLGFITASLANQGDLTAHGTDMIDSGAITSILVIEAADLIDASDAGVSYFGAIVDNDAIPAEGSFVGSVFESNPTRSTKIPGSGLVSLPIFDRADPTTIVLYEMEVELFPDGAGGYDGIVRGGFDPDDARAAAAVGFAQMIADDPADHSGLVGLFDVNHDGVVTVQEVADSAFIAALLEPDIALHGKQYLSAAFRVHALPCTGAGCLPPPVDPCFDRVLDGDETGVDCGGICSNACP